MMPPEDMTGRLARVRASLATLGLPALLVTRIDNVSWLTGFTGSNGFALITQERSVFATDSRYTTQAASQCPGFELTALTSSAPDEITSVFTSLGAPRLGFDSGHVTVALLDTYRSKLGSAVELVPTTGVIEDLRAAKDAGEIARIEKACELTDAAFTHVLPRLRAGAVERDVMLELEWFLRKDCGAEIAFDTIVASGPRSALPHGRAAERTMQPGDFVTLDFGARLFGYCADITRTVVLGNPTDEQQRVYGTVLAAMELAIEAIKPGAVGKDVDAVGRGHIHEAGYGDYFGHGLGHMLGRSVHDGLGFSKTSEVVLRPGMVLTVEPGIYIPDWGGVRIEQDVVVTDKGCRVITQSPTRLMAL